MERRYKTMGEKKKVELVGGGAGSPECLRQQAGDIGEIRRIGFDGPV